MTVPFKKKLSYLWERVSHKDRIYSHVFEKDVKAGVTGKPNYYMPAKSQLWLKATKVEGSDSSFKVSLCHYYTFLNANGKKISSDQNYYEELPCHGLVGNRKKIETFIKDWEAQQLKTKSTSPATKQPFKGFVKNKLTNS